MYIYIYISAQYIHIINCETSNSFRNISGNCSTLFYTHP